jgi:hypothetical protein
LNVFIPHLLLSGLDKLDNLGLDSNINQISGQSFKKTMNVEN